jgi:hypothetical protein
LAVISPPRFDGPWGGCGPDPDLDRLFLPISAGRATLVRGALLDRGDALPYGSDDIRPWSGRAGPRRPLRSPYDPRSADRTPESGRLGRPPVLHCILDARREEDALPDSARPCGFSVTTLTISVDRIQYKHQLELPLACGWRWLRVEVVLSVRATGGLRALPGNGRAVSASQTEVGRLA